MKVHNHVVQAYSRTAVTPVDGAAHIAPTAPAAEGDKGTSAAEVHVSEHARELAARNAYDPVKVETLKAKVASNEFHVDPHAIAKRIVDIVG